MVSNSTKLAKNSKLSFKNYSVRLTEATIVFGRRYCRTENTYLILLSQDSLLRKEVIQPLVPQRLPCYDFIPVTSPTFDRCLHEGWLTGFGRNRLP